MCVAVTWARLSPLELIVKASDVPVGSSWKVATAVAVLATAGTSCAPVRKATNVVDVAVQAASWPDGRARATLGGPTAATSRASAIAPTSARVVQGYDASDIPLSFSC